MREMSLSSTSVSLGPEGIMVGAATGYAPPTDLPQLGDALNLIRRDLREIGLAFKAVYDLKLGLEAEIARAAVDLGIRVDGTRKLIGEVGDGVEFRLAEVTGAVGMLRDQVASGWEDTSRQLSRMDVEILGRIASAEKATAEALYGIAQQAARDRMAAEEARRDAAARIERLALETGANFGDLREDIMGALAASETRVLDRLTTSIAAGSRTVALQFIASDQKASRLQSEILSAIANRAESDLAARKQMREEILNEIADIRTNAWAILWASMKASFKGIFKKREGN